jgi:Holliday junction DNA helicase RuvA
VPGVGAKFGLSILSVLSPEDVVKNIRAENPTVFTAASGVGAKLSQKIVLELKNKVQKNISGGGMAMPQNSNLAEAQSALLSLGFSQAEALAATKDCDVAWSIEEIVRLALKNLRS